MRVFACALLVIASAHAGLICEPGDSTDDGVTACFCLGNGIGWICAPMDRSAPLNIKETREVIESERTCEPGKFFKNDCNTCLCGSDGRTTSSVCTMMACNSPLPDKVKTCEPGQNFMDYCNSCTCGPSGLPICTQMNCDPEIWNKDGTMKKDVKVLLDEVKSCEPGQNFMDYCNSCTCGPSGLPICTQMNCDPEIWNKDGTMKKDVEVFNIPMPDELKNCEPGKNFKYYCNSCTCGADGEAACTKMACDPTIWNKDGSLKKDVKDANNILYSEIKTCEPGKSYNEFCNTCTCGVDGLPACTQKYCHPDVWNKDGTLKSTVKVVESSLSNKFKNCEPGKTFNDDCNSCICGTNGLVACTQMNCNSNVWNKDDTMKNTVKLSKSSLPDEVKTCEPGKSYNDFCNTCTCGIDGRPACTQMYCHPDVWNKDGTMKNTVKLSKSSLPDEVKTCEPGKSYNDFCNTCTCGVDGLPACTQMYCHPEIWNKDGTLKSTVKVVESSLSNKFKNCEPGKTFNDDCNSCICGTNGLVACTQMNCNSNVWNKDDTMKIKSEENQDTCEPEKSFKYYCNTCVCGPEGKISSSACTRIACNHNIWNQDGTMKSHISSNSLLRNKRSTQSLCQPDRVFMNDCNMCTCANNGKSFACTLMDCPPNNDGRSSALRVCEPRKHFKIDCNECMCNDDGTKIVCTKMACHSWA